MSLVKDNPRSHPWTHLGNLFRSIRLQK